VTPLAHAGHWAVQILYLVPLFAVVGALAWAKLRERRHTDHDRDV